MTGYLPGDVVATDLGCIRSMRTDKVLLERTLSQAAHGRSSQAVVRIYSLTSSIQIFIHEICTIHSCIYTATCLSPELKHCRILVSHLYNIVPHCHFLLLVLFFLVLYLTSRSGCGDEMVITSRPLYMRVPYSPQIRTM